MEALLPLFNIYSLFLSITAHPTKELPWKEIKQGEFKQDDLLTQFCTFRNLLKLKLRVIMSHSSSSYTRKEKITIWLEYTKSETAPHSTQISPSFCMPENLQNRNSKRSLTTYSFVFNLSTFIYVVHFSFKRTTHPATVCNEMNDSFYYATYSILPWFHQHWQNHCPPAMPTQNQSIKLFMSEPQDSVIKDTAGLHEQLHI